MAAKRRPCYHTDATDKEWLSAQALISPLVCTHCRRPITALRRAHGMGAGMCEALSP
jgi:hypothetical protein